MSAEPGVAVMNSRRHAACHALSVAALAWAGAAACQAQPSTAPVDAQQAPFESAMAEYERHHFGSAFQALSLLADQGHADAARIALLMCAHGPRLYGQRFSVGEVQRERWLTVALSHAAARNMALVR